MNYIKEILTEIKSDLPDNPIIHFLESMEEIDYGIYEKRDYFVESYGELIDIYRKRLNNDKAETD